MKKAAKRERGGFVVQQKLDKEKLTLAELLAAAS